MAWVNFMGVHYCLIKLILLLYIINMPKYGKCVVYRVQSQISYKTLEMHKEIVDKYYAQRKSWATSNLGSILYKNANPHLYVHPKRQRTHLILMQHFVPPVTMRTLYWQNITLKDCAVTNCKFTQDIAEIDRADAVVVSILDGDEYIPKVRRRNRGQIWILYSDESPMHAYSGNTTGPNLKKISNIFNWTMTYRSDSDIPVPYGRTVPLLEPVTTRDLKQLVPYWDKKQSTVLATIIMSRCDIPHQLLYVSKLREHMMIDVEGLCFFGEKQMSCVHSIYSDLEPDCKNTERYLFYLVFETAKCRQYLTEKCFHYGYSKGAIPVIMGPSLHDCKKLLPPDSFLHIDNYKSPLDLVNHLNEIAKDEAYLLSFHAWRRHFDVVNEHGFYGTISAHYCRVCEAINYNDGEEKIYDKDDLSLFFDEKLVCEVSYNSANYPLCPKKPEVVVRKPKPKYW